MSRQFNWIHFGKQALVTAICSAVVTGGSACLIMLLNHDKMLAVINTKVTIIMNHVAPEAGLGLANK